jgi:HAD superfamily hydrolase (TIGR01484 family)
MIAPMSRRYDILAIDLDGTLLRSDGTISQRNIQAVRAARERGIEVVIATGRALSESRASLAAIDHTGMLIAAGGSLLCDASSGATIDRIALEPETVREITRWLVEHDHAALILKDAHAVGYDYLVVGASELDPASRWWFARMEINLRRVAGSHEDEHPEHTVRAGAVASEERLAPLARRLREEFGDRCSMQHWSAVTSTHAVGSPTHLLEIFSANVNKSTMLMRFCDRRGTPTERVAAIGDGLNDVELVGCAGLGIAMGNAGPEVRAVAQRHTAHHDEDGVAIAIDRILDGAW